MLWCENCQSQREGEFCNSCGSPLQARALNPSETPHLVIVNPTNRILLISYLASAIAAIVFTVTLFVGSSIGVLKIEYSDAATAYGIYSKAMDNNYNLWLECRETAYDVDECKSYGDANMYSAEQAAPFFSKMLWSEAEIQRRTGYISFLQSVSVSLVLLSGLLFVSNRIKLKKSKSSDKTAIT